MCVLLLRRRERRGSVLQRGHLASAPGEWPVEAEEVGRIRGVLEGAGISMWELSNVDNSACLDSPLDPALMAMGA